MTAVGYICPTCKSHGFDQSSIRPLACTFCDGSEGGNKPVNTRERIPEGMISLTIGQGHVVHGTMEAIHHAQAVLLIDSKHPVEKADINRYFARQAQELADENRRLRNIVMKLKGNLLGSLQDLENL